MTQILQQTQECMPISVCCPASPTLFSVETARAIAPYELRHRLMHRSKQHLYSITSSARSRSDSEIVSPIAFAVLLLMRNSNLVGCSTGKSAGFSPLRI